ncbi:2-oxo-4-hydroxy-4-carboxy-5-ureidoimidazoline decarboxylase [Saccharothrix tamanrassetensis]|uniref:2-oxo-4-hydroxy-4-carboxy-5-ureidoimidazoline decarboxylase n=1 Tax=Saccharothrix tamanrassetensis TaxID=1051531 RepID=A0A841CEZ1_9PSEU|nr:2-oxo-4-hydroxy-4-carboxy-5-ureidoimidazoline decarboxylase [Saccharothrix tamanrassetensis]MBB5955523.1 2-oxo-4-hydroxy-4-carboxy-5-ureidoimidazoline decarboxylase [Saccharothrix tamanrassetensis]
MPDLDGFNSAPAAELRPLLAECLAVPRWVDAVLAGRPYASVDALLAASDRAASLSDDEVRAAIAGHPRIGEKSAHGGVSARWSADEQSGVAGTLAERLKSANQAYEDRFGHIYLVCATGLSGEQVLADLASRLEHPADAELRVVNRELAEIAALRLRKVLDRHDTRGS